MYIYFGILNLFKIRLCEQNGNKILSKPIYNSFVSSIENLDPLLVCIFDFQNLFWL